MFRYRCPQCRQILQAPEIRAGKATVCPKCSQKITIPADQSQWINEAGETVTTTLGETKRIGEPSKPVKRESEIFVDEMAPIRVTMNEPEPAELAALPEAETPLSHVSAAVVEFQKEPVPEEIPAPIASASNFSAATPVPKPTPIPLSPPAVSVKAPELPDVSAATPAPAPSGSGSIPLPASHSSPSITITPPVEKPIRPPVETPRVDRPRPRQVRATPTLVPARGSYSADDEVSFNSPLHLRSDMDIAAALTDMLTSRMKPPPKPPRDLYPSTAFWLLFTGIATALLGMTLFGAVDHRKWVVYLGAAQMAVGYIWIVILAYRREPSSAFMCALPPLTVWYLTRRRYRKYRPLRFVMTGAFFIAMAGLAPYAMPYTREFAGLNDVPAVVGEPEAGTLSEIEQLREYRNKRQFDKLIALLRKLDRTDPLFSTSTPKRAELAAELRNLADPAVTNDSSVRAAALPAYARWEGDGSRALLLTAIERHPDERREAIKLLPRWSDAGVATVLASRLGNREETTLAKSALIDLGGPVVAQALMTLLRDKEKDKLVHLAALDLLAHPRIGDETVLTFLRAEKDKFSDQALNRQVELKILEIQNNLRQKQG